VNNYYNIKYWFEKIHKHQLCQPNATKQNYHTNNVLGHCISDNLFFNNNNKNILKAVIFQTAPYLLFWEILGDARLLDLLSLLQ